MTRSPSFSFSEWFCMISASPKLSFIPADGTRSIYFTIAWLSRDKGSVGGPTEIGRKSIAERIARHVAYTHQLWVANKPGETILDWELTVELFIAGPWIPIMHSGVTIKAHSTMRRRTMRLQRKTAQNQDVAQINWSDVSEQASNTKGISGYGIRNCDLWRRQTFNPVDRHRISVHIQIHKIRFSDKVVPRKLFVYVDVCGDA